MACFSYRPGEQTLIGNGIMGVDVWPSARSSPRRLFAAFLAFEKEWGGGGGGAGGGGVGGGWGGGGGEVGGGWGFAPTADRRAPISLAMPPRRRARLCRFRRPSR